MEKLVLFMCYRYDPDANSYVASAWKIMRLGGVITVIVIGTGLTILFRRGPRRSQHVGPSSTLLQSGPAS